MDGLDARGCAQIERELNGCHCRCYFNAIVGLKFDADLFEQEELVVVNFRWIRLQIMKLTGNLGMKIRK
jgi:hypothetical protein